MSFFLHLCTINKNFRLWIVSVLFTSKGAFQAQLRAPLVRNTLSIACWSTSRSTVTDNTSTEIIRMFHFNWPPLRLIPLCFRYKTNINLGAVNKMKWFLLFPLLSIIFRWIPPCFATPENKVVIKWNMTDMEYFPSISNFLQNLFFLLNICLKANHY